MSLNRSRLNQWYGLDLRSLAFFRICLGALLIYDLILRFTDLAAHYTDQGVLPRSFAIQAMSPWYFSLHLMNGTPFVQALLFLLAGIFALALLVGYRTRWSTFWSWVLLISLQSRNPILLTGGDIELRMILFWSLFLPLGATFSLDRALNWGGKEGDSSSRFLSLGSVGYLLQIAFLYFFTATLKSGPMWHRDATAIYYTLSLDMYTTPFGQYFLQFPGLLRFLTTAALGFEYTVPIFLILPAVRGYARMAAVMGLIALHAGFWFCLTLGIFPYVSIVAVLPLVPSLFWERVMHIPTPGRGWACKIYYDQECAFCHKMVLILRTFLVLPQAEIIPGQAEASTDSLMKRKNSWIVENVQGKRFVQFEAFLQLLQQSPWLGFFAGILSLPGIRHLGLLAYKSVARNRSLFALLTRNLEFKSLVIQATPLQNILAGFFIIFVLVWNWQTVKPSLSLPKNFKRFGYFLRLNQNWKMFSAPSRWDGWFVIPGNLVNGREVDIFRAGEEVTWDKPEVVSQTFKNHRWRKYLRQLSQKENKKFRKPYLQYLCRSWNRSHSKGEKLKNMKFFFMYEKTLPDYQTPEVKKRLLYKYECIKEKVPKKGEDSEKSGDTPKALEEIKETENQE